MNIVVPHSLDGERIDRTVAVLTELPRSTVAKMLTDGMVTINAKVVAKPAEKVHTDDELTIELPDTSLLLPKAEADVPFRVVHEDEYLLVIDKPAGVIVHPGAGKDSGTLVHGLLSRYPELAETVPGGDPMRPGIVHRLDAGTSGLMIVARTPEAHIAIVEAMQAREIERRYLTLAWGLVEPEIGMIEAPIGRSDIERTKMVVSKRGKPARTRYQVLAHHNDPPVSWVSVKLETGRTHQIRVHFTALGHPVVGDRRYGGARYGLDVHRPFLHAHTLRFNHPVTGKELYFLSDLPEDLQVILNELGLESVPVPRAQDDALVGDVPDDDDVVQYVDDEDI